MNMRSLIPWNRNSDKVPTFFTDDQANPFLALHREVNRLFDDAFRGFNTPALFGGGLGSGWPSLEITETEKELQVAAELPGLEEKDVEVLLSDNVLTVRGEKKSEREDKERQFSERFYGRFERQVPLNTEIETDKVSATFKNGVLTVTLPKTATAQVKAKRIAINGQK